MLPFPFVPFVSISDSSTSSVFFFLWSPRLHHLFPYEWAFKILCFSDPVLQHHVCLCMSNTFLLHQLFFFVSDQFLSTSDLVSDPFSSAPSLSLWPSNICSDLWVSLLPEPLVPLLPITLPFCTIYFFLWVILSFSTILFLSMSDLFILQDLLLAMSDPLLWLDLFLPMTDLCLLHYRWSFSIVVLLCEWSFSSTPAILLCKWLFCSEP